MIKKTPPAKKQLSAKDKIITETTQILSTSLRALKDAFGEKKFEKRIKKAAKILVQGFKEQVKQEVAEKAPVKKARVGRPRKILAPTPEKVAKAVSKKKAASASKSAKETPKK